MNQSKKSYFTKAMIQNKLPTTKPRELIIVVEDLYQRNRHRIPVMGNQF